MIHLVPVKCDQINCTRMSAQEHMSEGMIHYVPAKYDQISCTRMSA